MLIDYLNEIATIEDNNFLLSQLSNFCIDEESCWVSKFIAVLITIKFIGYQ